MKNILMEYKGDKYPFMGSYLVMFCMYLTDLGLMEEGYE
jgi:hypothetical protein